MELLLRASRKPVPFRPVPHPSRQAVAPERIRANSTSISPCSWASRCSRRPRRRAPGLWSRPLPGSSGGSREWYATSLSAFISRQRPAPPSSSRASREVGEDQFRPRRAQKLARPSIPSIGRLNLCNPGPSNRLEIIRRIVGLSSTSNRRRAVIDLVSVRGVELEFKLAPVVAGLEDPAPLSRSSARQRVQRILVEESLSIAPLLLGISEGSSQHPQ